MQLENMIEMYQPRVSEPRQQSYFVVGDLENLSASVLYSGTSEYDKYVREEIRGDDHKPYGEHINYEVWMDKTGKDDGRSRLITNVHIPLQKGS
ncbi:hypothetical protein KAS08_00850 [Candidatus Pacearchaeota archaeon]|nr:hypothetical protein [Candidatus Pacearchaeota archaeon]